MKTFFISSLFPEERIKEIQNNSKSGIDNAANNFQWALLKGLDYYYPDLKVITLPAIRSYPRYYKKAIYKSSSFQHKNNSKDKVIGFINIPIVKHLSKTINLKKKLTKLIKAIEEDIIIFIYAIHSPFVKSAIDFKRHNPNVKICLIVPDLPQYMSGNGSLIYRFFKSIDTKLINRYLKEVDSFVLLSDYMTDALLVEDRPWTRVEGIFEQPDNFEFAPKEVNKTILYTGSLARRYGIINLLDAFDAIKDSNYRLWICGEGDSRNEIEKRAKSDARIKYFGQQARSNVLTLQKKATVLVNPRTSEGEFTKYSFPSKTMEYLASGTPCILYRLQGIPDEYFQYCFIVNNENIDELTEMIMTVCSKDQSELNDFGEKAAQFILNEKNPIIQVKKIIEMINK